ncbi:disintegrin and metalloproteinase domain-containing protein 10-like [Centruroides sculpturatus]|uniref:disintegrin and metalloproteinase domain-containing protein 10-like n=1 Tax=Centruroides sculpturatus TaxID=218467 RepID=UPI000C6D6383|nr:disintegrin and metalloproteinase domain-containing protein 10-like [Centruroides sculpturatus]
MHPNIRVWASGTFNFSSYCKKKIRQFIKRKEIDFCLKSLQRSVCGNGIVEDGESCDCDYSTGKCNIQKTCCTNKNSPLPCTIQRKKDCSPATDECCNSNCKLNTRNDIKCLSNILCHNTTDVCATNSSFCPMKRQPDRSPCIGTSKTCRSGKCISNVCKDNGLKSCSCLPLKWECHICCESKPKICQSAESLGYVPSNHQLYIKVEGSYCDKNFGICMSDGSCLSKKSYSVWYYMSPLPFVILIIVGLTYLPGRSKSNYNEDILTTIRKKKVMKSQQKDKEEKQSSIKTIKQEVHSLSIKSKKDIQLPTQEQQESQEPTEVKKKFQLPIRLKQKQKQIPMKTIKKQTQGEPSPVQTQVERGEQSTSRANPAKKVKVFVKKKLKPKTLKDEN